MSTSEPSPTISSIAPSPSTPKPWFDYPVRVQPHHTDYAGIVWHGAYVNWMEEARVECLRAHGVNFSNLVELGCDLPVVELSIRYRRSLKMGMDALVSTQMKGRDGVRLNWVYNIQSLDRKELYVTAVVTLVPVDRARGKIMRQLPSVLEEALDLCLGQTVQPTAN